MNSNILKSIGAVVTGFVFVVIISVVTDTILIKTGIMQQPFELNPAWFIVLVIVYRCVYAMIGSYITARLAPDKPMRLVMIGGAIGFAISIIGLIVMWDQSPHWYGIALIITALPCA